ncbi:uncharacterized protein L203_105629 [Cryptococcus depauperatus CBS 7841]|uniref:Uncharacterized protein n=1 Tax=Cryptococcus depauperatus CBS 7841 TaxID=1295531 RepID=A0A1E3IF67_9TREE|nr:hypothetical protein L203_03505 [Cryptococcus depauperatus CBS 7841]
MEESSLAGDRLNEERAFVKRYTEGLASFKVGYPADFSAPLEERPRKIPAIGILVAEPPSGYLEKADTSTHDVVSLIVKSLKPPLTIPITAHLTDTVSDLKTLVAKSSSTAPKPDTQRLLLKGKALTDTKLLKEYAIDSGVTIHLMIKAPLAASSGNHSPALSVSEATNQPPSLTITTALDESTNAGTSMPLSVMDREAPPLGPQPQVSSAAFHETIADPAFWQRIYALCVSQFDNQQEAVSAWETFLLSMKSRLSAGEAAKIRDAVGITGMAGH